MIKATVQEVREAFRAFSVGIGTVSLPPKAAWRVARLITKLKPIVRDFEETQRKMLLDAGGVNEGGAIVLKLSPRKDDEKQEDFDKREAVHVALVTRLNEGMDELTKEEVEIAYDPIPLSLFENEKDPAKSPDLKPVDLANAGPFLTE